MLLPLTPHFKSGRAMLLAGLREFHRFETAATTTLEQWARFRLLDGLPEQAGVVRYGVMCQTNIAEQRFEYMCAQEVATFDALPAGVGRMRVPAAQYAVFHHSGPATTVQGTWHRIWTEWMPTVGTQLAPTPDFEQYYPSSTTQLGPIEIWIPVLQPTAEHLSITA
jgi:predicted transcriptional regulator YdeE